MSSVAYLQGYDAGRVAATGGATGENPYRDATNRAAWASGFADAYSEFKARNPYGTNP